MTDNNNPAYRLITLIKKAKEISGKGPDVPSLVGWAKVFELQVPPGENHLKRDAELELFRQLSQVDGLIQSVKLSLEAIPNINHQLYLTPFDSLYNILPLNTRANGNFRVIMSSLSDSDMVILEFCVEKLSEHPNEPLPDEKELEAILQDINYIYEGVRAASIEVELKTFLLDELEMLRRAIHDYRIRGFDGLKQAMPGVVGTYVITRDWLEKTNIADEEKGLIDSFLNLLSRYGAAVSFAANTTKLLEAASTHLPKLLPGG